MKEFTKQLFSKGSVENTKPNTTKANGTNTHNNTQDTLCFIHIPKTAGTSFRKGAFDYFGEDNCLLDYHHNPLTSDVFRAVHNETSPDLYQLKQTIDMHPCSFYTGHVNFGKANVLFSPLQMVSFLRNPLKQVVSHFNHHKSLHDYPGDLSQFIQSPKFQNVQSKYLKGAVPELFGVIGITEHYDESLAIVNHTFGTDIQPLVKNIGTTPKNSAKPTLDYTITQLIEQHNKDDINLYSRCVSLLNQRLNCLQNDDVWTHGKVLHITASHVSGWAFRRESDDPVELELLINGVVVNTFLAKDNRPHLRGVRVNIRDAFIGFHASIYPKTQQKLASTDIVEVRCVDTKQTLFENTLVAL